MSNEMFTQLPTVISATLGDVICAVQGYVSPSNPGQSVQETLGQILTLMQSNIIQNFAGNPNGNVAGNKYGLCWDNTDSVLYVCTTSGNSATAVWTLAGSVTLPVPMASGGTGKSLTAANGGIVYSDASSMEILAATATASQVLQSGSNSAPSWSTATYPSTTTINQILYSSSANAVSGISTANSAMLVTNSSGVPSFTSSMTNGQLVIGSTGATPTTVTLTAGPGISISNGAGSITISGTASSIGWNVITTNTNMVAENGYICNSGSLITVTLPTTAGVGTALAISNYSTGGFTIAQNSGQNIRSGSSITTTGVGGSLSSTAQGDGILLVCVVANTSWICISAPQGNLTIV